MEDVSRSGGMYHGPTACITEGGGGVSRADGAMACITERGGGGGVL